MAATVTLSSVGTSNGIVLDYVGAKTTSLALILGSTTMTADFTIQITLDSSVRGDTVNWVGLSTTHYTSAIADSGAYVSITTPVAGVRINSSTLSSASITLKALQNAGG